jgi:mRNA-degrading endonuclease RelE of RelBE toxin-antitoxin system
MAYRVQIPVELWSTFKALPTSLVERLHRRIEDIAQLAEQSPPLNPLWFKLGATDRPLLRCMVEGYVLLYEVDESCRTVSVLDVEQEEAELPVPSSEWMTSLGRH